MPPVAAEIIETSDLPRYVLNNCDIFKKEIIKEGNRSCLAEYRNPWIC